MSVCDSSFKNLVTTFSSLLGHQAYIHTHTHIYEGKILIHINKSKNTKHKTEKEETNYQKQGESKDYRFLEHW